MKWVPSLAAGLALLLVSAPADAGPAELASYRALFDLALDEGGKGVDRANVAGRMAVEFTGSRCTGYKSKMRLVTEGENADGKRQVTDARTETVETADGRFDFTNQTYVNDNLAEEAVGTAQRTANGTAFRRGGWANRNRLR